MAKNKVKCKTYTKAVRTTYTHMPHTKVKRIRHKNNIQEPFFTLEEIKHLLYNIVTLVGYILIIFLTVCLLSNKY